MSTVHDFEVRTIDGETRKLSDYAGKVCLIVNVASACGLTPHYAGLEALYRELKDQGLVVLGFPCNQFGAQEPGTEADIKAFCTSKYDVTFPMFAKIDVNGPGAHPLYAHLTAAEVGPEGKGPVQWNFGKFVVGRDGAVRARFAPTTKPTDHALRQAIADALAA
jgi:glutathione peroxidase